MTDNPEALTDAQWRERLTPEQYAVLRQGGTERAFTGKYEKNKAAGEYVCAGCGQPLFESEDKYDSGSGWPSFVRPAGDGAVMRRSRSMLPSAPYARERDASSRRKASPSQSGTMTRPSAKGSGSPETVCGPGVAAQAYSNPASRTLRTVSAVNRPCG